MNRNQRRVEKRTEIEKKQVGQKQQTSAIQREEELIPGWSESYHQLLMEPD